MSLPRNTSNTPGSGSSGSGNGATAYPPRSSVRSSFSSSSNNAAAAAAAAAATTSTNRPWTSQPQQQQQQSREEEWQSSRRSASSSPRRATTTTSSSSGSHNNNTPKTTLKTSPRHSKSTSSIHNNSRPWNNAEEFELLPTRGIQNQTGGRSRTTTFVSASASATAVAAGAITSRSQYNNNRTEGLGLYPADYSLSQKQPQPQRSHSLSTARPQPQKSAEEYYDAYGYSDFARSSSTSSATTTNTNAASSSSKKEDAYARYLQQKERDKLSSSFSTGSSSHTTVPKQPYSFTKSSSFGGTTSTSATAAATNTTTTTSSGGRPPRRSPSPSDQRRRRPSPVHLIRSTSSSNSDLEIQQFDATHHDNDSDTDDNDAPTSARALRARRLAQQQAQPRLAASDLRLQSHNPAVQAYLTRKNNHNNNNMETTTTRERSSLSSGSGSNTNFYDSLLSSSSPSSVASRPSSVPHQRHSHTQYASNNDADTSLEEDDTTNSHTRTAQRRREQRIAMEPQQPQHQSHQQQQSWGERRPPAAPASAPPAALVQGQVESNVTTYTYKFQPPPPSSSPPQQQQQHLQHQSSDTSVIRAKRLLLQSSYTSNSHSHSSPSLTNASTTTTTTSSRKQYGSDTEDSDGVEEKKSNNHNPSSLPRYSTTTTSSSTRRSMHGTANSMGNGNQSSSTPKTATTGDGNNSGGFFIPLSKALGDIAPRQNMDTFPTTNTNNNNSASARAPEIHPHRPTTSSDASSSRRISPPPNNDYSDNHNNEQSHSRHGSSQSLPTPILSSSTTSSSSSPSSSSILSSADYSGSVTRARRLLQEGKGRSASLSNSISTITNLSTTVASTTSSGRSTSVSGSSYHGFGSGTGNNNDNSNLRRIVSDGGRDNNSPNSNNNNNVPVIPRPHLLQSIPSNLENDDWSIRVCVISAVDFPVHVVPNMPLSPVLKVGLVSIPSVQETSYGKERLLRDIDRKGLGAVSDQMRCTTTKLLSKRDNGAVEFHEELRWDHVALKPAAQESLALAVELCARGVLRPANLHESPPPHNASSFSSADNANAHAAAASGGGGGLGLLTPLRGRAVTPSPAAGGGGRRSPESLSDVNAGATNNQEVGRGGRIMSFLARRQRGKADATQMESANAAAAVAKLLVQGSTSPLTPAKPVTGPGATVPPPPPVPLPTPTMTRSGLVRTGSGSVGPVSQEWDVTLRKPLAATAVVAPSSPPSNSAAATAASSTTPVIMTDDIRLGSLLIPLTELEDLQRVLNDRSRPARLEKWFEVQNMNAAVMNSNNASSAPSTGGRWLGRDTSNSGSGSRSQSPNVGSNAAGGARSRRNPSILLELSLYAPDVLDDSEDEMEDDAEENSEDIPRQVIVPKSFAKRTTMQVRNQLQQQMNSNAANAATKSPKRDKRDDAKQSARASPQDPVLEPGIIDFIAIVGARDIGDQRQDDGSKGWVQSTPECCVLEQFPPTDDFHVQQNQHRSAVLPQKVEWFCFPDGVKLWRGPEPPAASDFLSQQQQQQQQASPIMTPSQIMVSEAESTSLALFDAYLNCTTSFNWFVIASNSDEYGSHMQKTYGAVIRFYVPAPRGIDPTQDDFAQTLMGSGNVGVDDDDMELWNEQEQEEEDLQQSRGMIKKKEKKKRLWVPIGICVTSSLPIIGVMEAILMRCCEMLASRPKIEPSKKNKINNMIQRHLANLILNCQQPLAGAVNCSVPFLLGESLQVRLAPRAGLPPLPHGNSVASVCRLLGPEGFIFVLAALLTESKVLLHSHNVANCAMVAEVMTALIYPFHWSLPYIPVLPTGMLEFIEAPLSYLLGISSSCLEQNMVEDSVLEDVVVVDLDNGFSSPDWKTTTTKYKSPTPLPSLVASNISRAVYRLLRALENEHEFEEKHSHPVSNASDRLPRIHPESKAEREFRIAIALEMGGLVRGYQDCLVFVSTSQPVFNREKFLKRAPALFIEEPSGGAVGSRANKVKTNRRILSSRSKRFLSILVNCQHFHQFLEALRTEECSFFHEVMEMWIKGDESNKGSDVSVFESSSSFDHNKAIAQLSKSLQALEDKVTMYEVKLPHSNKPNGSCPVDDILQDEDYQILSREKRFPRNLLQQIDVGTSDNKDQDNDVTSVTSKSSSQQMGVHHASLSVQYLVELEKNPWRYRNVLDISVPSFGSSAGEKQMEISEVIAGDQSVLITEKVKLRDAIGERKYRAWKLSREQLGEDMDLSGSNSLEDNILNPGGFGTSLDLASLMTSATEDIFSETSSQSSLTNISSSSRGANPNSRFSLTPEQQRVANAKDRDVLRRCLEKAYSAKPSNKEETKDFSDIFTHHGRDLVSEAEVALRNPSAQHFLLSLLSKRAKLDENQKQLQGHSPGERRLSRRSTTSSSRLEPVAFECVVRLCCAMLDSCMETKDYEPAYLLLCHTAGLFAMQQNVSGANEGANKNEEGIKDDAARDLQPMYMTARIGLHPLFADLGLWEKVMSLHLAEKQSMGNASDRLETGASPESGGSLPSLSHSESFENDGPVSDSGDEKEYEAAVATLYEMLGYGIPAEELARFATKISREYGWFAPGIERGQSLLLLARRLSMRRELAENGGFAPGESGDFAMMKVKASTEVTYYEEAPPDEAGSLQDDDALYETVEIGWCHPAAPAVTGARGSISGSSSSGIPRGGGQQTEYMNRSAVTALATFGPSVVVSGGLDGGVFLAHLAPRTDEGDYAVSFGIDTNAVVRGLHLDWGSSGSRAMPGASAASSADGEYGVGAVSCLAAATGAGGHQQRSSMASTKDVLCLMDEEDIMREMEDSRIIAGTTCGDLRIWSVKDVYAAMHAAQTGEDNMGFGGEGGRLSHAGLETSTTSSFIPSTPGRRRLGGSTTSEPGLGGGANNPFNRLKFSLRGRALSGHRGGVVCVDVPSHVYRPDSVVTGGADGLIKLWSLRTPSIGRRTSDNSSFLAAAASSTAAGQLGRRLASNRGGDALSVLSGHGGRVLCVKTAWHGDRLLSGGADRTIRIWDMMSSGTNATSGGVGSDAACLHTLSGHFGWVTHVQYWGPNTIVSGSTDRSIALWDARVRNSPLFVLRHHHAPISDLLVGSRTDPLMVSAASDGTVTTWDFRSLSGAANDSGSQAAASSEQQPRGTKQCKVERHPAAVMDLGSDQERFSLARSGPVLLSRGDHSPRTVLSTGSDAILREWEISTGQLVKQWNTGHCDALTSLKSLAEASSQSFLGMSSNSEGASSLGGTLTSSWDGTIRFLARVKK